MHRSRPTPLALAVACATLAACDRPVEWRGEPDPLASAAVEADGADATDAPLRLVMMPGGAGTLEPVAPPFTSPAASDPSACAGSVRTSASGRELYAVWWSARPSGRAALVAARSDDGGMTWTSPVPVDTTDQSVVACDRPPPAIYADTTSRYLHVTYFVRGREGPGVFFSHSMERGALFHAPVPIIYGERPSLTAVTAADSLVVVAFEDPNSPRGRVALAVSRTWGHIFTRDRPAVSSSMTPAQSPLVALRGDTILVAWRDPTGHIVARAGRLR